MIKAEEIINKQFSRAFWGYDIGEVDTILDEIVRANERAEQELENHVAADVEGDRAGAEIELPHPREALAHHRDDLRPVRHEALAPGFQCPVIMPAPELAIG